MATQATTQTAYKLLCAELADAIAAADWATAYSKYAQASAVLVSFERSTTGAAGNVTVLREDLAGVKVALDAAIGALKYGDTKRFARTRMGRGMRRDNNQPGHGGSCY